MAESNGTKNNQTRNPHRLNEKIIINTNGT